MSYLDEHRLPLVSSGKIEEYTENLCLHELFELQVLDTPDETAIIDDNKKLTYRELNEQADLLALYLRTKGVTVDCPVPIHCERSAEYCIAYLAALKAGGCYLPLELAYPKPLINEVLKDSSAKVVLTKEVHCSNLDDSGVEYFCLDDGWMESLLEEEEEMEASAGVAQKPTLDSLAYMVYSSGTTGKPKGICCPHRGAVNSYIWRFGYADYGPGDVMGANVFFVWEFFRPLLRGAAVYVIGDNVIYDVPNLLDVCEKNNVSEILFTPTLLETILNTGGAKVKSCLRNLRVVWLCGEVVTVKLRNRFVEALPGVRLLNLYSISECHDIAALDLVSYVPPSSLAGSDYCPVGEIMPAAFASVLDEDMQPVEKGELGELFIGGSTLAREYLNRPELTAARFVTAEVEVGGQKSVQRMYRTGDRARVLPDCGMVEITGRCDFMVKIRGYSVNLGAIENTISKKMAVKSCAVLPVGKEGEEKVLVAYLVRDQEKDKKKTKGGEVLTEWEIIPFTGACREINLHLQKFLPHYMIPSVYIEIDSLPIQVTTGKIDRKKLPVPSLDRIAERRGDEEDRQNLMPTDYPAAARIEVALVGIFEEILRVQAGTIELDDDFFVFGGHSLSATRLLTIVGEVFGVKVTVLELFDVPTPRALAGLVMTRQQEVVTKGNSESESEDEDKRALNVTAAGRARLDLEEEARLDPRIVPTEVVPPEEWTTLAMASAVFLTGCTGFLGAFLLSDVLEKTKATVLCIVRPRGGDTSERALKAVIKKNLDQYNLQVKDWARVKPIAGDLSKLRMGMDEDEFESVAKECDCIIHSGAHVNLVYPYAALKPANVQGTTEILKLAVMGRAKAKTVIHISTNAVLPAGADVPRACERVYSEDDELADYSREVTGGYGQSKWVAERMIWEARNRGVPVVVIRPGNIAGHTLTGSSNMSDHIFLTISACIKAGCFPRVDEWVFEMTPVDFISHIILTLGSNPTYFNQAYHLIDPTPVSAAVAMRWVEGILGVSLDEVEFEEWRRRVKGAFHALTEAEISIFAELDTPESLSSSSSLQVSSSKVDAVAAEAGRPRQRVNARSFQQYIQFYRKKGLILANQE